MVTTMAILNPITPIVMLFHIRGIILPKMSIVRRTVVGRELVPFPIIPFHPCMGNFLTYFHIRVSPGKVLSPSCGGVPLAAYPHDHPYH